MRNIITILALLLSFGLNSQNLIDKIKADASKYNFDKIYKEKDVFTYWAVSSFYANDYKIKEFEKYIGDLYENLDSDEDVTIALSFEQKKEAKKYVIDYVLTNSVDEEKEYFKYSPYLATRARMTIIKAIRNKYYNELEITDEELLEILDKNDLRPSGSRTKEIFLGSSFSIKEENKKKGVKYNRDLLYSKLDIIFTKENIINNTDYFENKKQIEKYTICNNCYGFENHPFGKGEKSKRDFNIVFANNEERYIDDENHNIIIYPDDLKDIPFSLENEISENMLKTANYFINLIDENLVAETNMGADFFLSEGNKKAQAGDFSAAIESYDNAIRLDKSSSPDLHRLRGFAKKRNNDFKGAIIDLTKALELTEKGSEYEMWTETILIEMAFCKVFTKDAYGAIFDCTKAIELNPNSAEAFGIRGLAKATINDISGSCSDVKKAAELGNYEYEKMLGPSCNGNE